MIKIKKGDEVVIMRGKDKGQKGKVSKILKKSAKVLIPGLNIYKRHLKPQGEKKPGGIIEVSRPLPIGSVALICPKCKKPVRVGFKIEGTTKSRICKKCGEVI